MTVTTSLLVLGVVDSVVAGVSDVAAVVVATSLVEVTVVSGCCVVADAVSVSEVTGS